MAGARAVLGNWEQEAERLVAELDSCLPEDVELDVDLWPL
jgi:hypothetical protein